jgi:hypothetical protein
MDFVSFLGFILVALVVIGGIASWDNRKTPPTPRGRGTVPPDEQDGGNGGNGTVSPQ